MYLSGELVDSGEWIKVREQCRDANRDECIESADTTDALLESKENLRDSRMSPSIPSSSSSLSSLFSSSVLSYRMRCK
jgi:hypothetical protein